MTEVTQFTDRYLREDQGLPHHERCHKPACMLSERGIRPSEELGLYQRYLCDNGGRFYLVLAARYHDTAIKDTLKSTLINFLALGTPIHPQ